jgi:hypothetical protein
LTPLLGGHSRDSREKVKASDPASRVVRRVRYFSHATTFHLVCAIAFAVLVSVSPALAAISDLRVEQTLTVIGTTYAVTPALKISFHLSQASPVTVKISRHLARYEQFKWPYLAKPVLVR